MRLQDDIGVFAQTGIALKDDIGVLAPAGNIATDVVKGLGRGTELAVGGTVHGLTETSTHFAKNWPQVMLKQQGYPDVVANVANAWWKNKTSPAIDPLRDIGRDVRDTMTRLASTGWEKRDPRITLKDHPARFIASGVGEAAPMMAGAIATSVITQNPLAGASIFFPQAVSDMFTEAKKNGLSDDDAINLGVINGLAQTALEVIPLKGFLKGGKVLTRIVRGMVQEGIIEEGSQQLFSNMLQVAAWKSKQPGYSAKQFRDDMFRGVAESVAVGVTMGGLMGAAGPRGAQPGDQYEFDFTRDIDKQTAKPSPQNAEWAHKAKDAEDRKTRTDMVTPDYQADFEYGRGSATDIEIVDADKFVANFKDAQYHKYGAALTFYSSGDYQGKQAVLYLTKDRKSGFAITPDSELISVFSTEEGRGKSLVEQAVKRGATKLDAAEIKGKLPKLYSEAGFVEYKRESWQGAPMTVKGTGQQVSPDVVYMRLDKDAINRTQGELLNEVFSAEQTKLYRGTSAGFGGVEGAGDIRSDIAYLSTSKAFAQEFGESVQEYYFKGKNLYDFEKTGGFYKDKNGEFVLDEDGEQIEIGFLDANPEVVADMKARGYDGAIDGGGEFTVAFDPADVKTAPDVQSEAQRDAAISAFVMEYGDLLRDLTRAYLRQGATVQARSELVSTLQDMRSRLEQLPRTQDQVDAQATEHESTLEPVMESYYSGPMTSPVVENITKQLKAAKNWLLEKLDLEYIFKKLGAPETGLQLKTMLGKHSMWDMRAAGLIGKLAERGTLTKREWGMTAIAAQYVDITKAPEKSRVVIEELLQKDDFKKAVQQVRKIFDEYATILEQRLPDFEKFPQSKIRRNNNAIGVMEADIKKELLEKTPDAAKITAWREDISKRLGENEFLSNIAYVHLPIRYWLRDKLRRDPRFAKNVGLLTGELKQLLGRETATLEDLMKVRVETGRTVVDDAGAEVKETVPIITLEELDVREIVASYVRYVGHQMAQRDVLDAAIKEKVVVERGKEVADPELWVHLSETSFPMFKKHKVRADAAQSFQDFFQEERSGISKLFAITKMWRFANPLFLPMYDMFQAAAAGAANLNVLSPRWRQAAKANHDKSALYWEAYENGLFSVPFRNPYNNFLEQLRTAMEEQDSTAANQMQAFLRKAKAFKGKKGWLATAYSASWESAWFLDHLIRLQTYITLKDRGLPARDAAQVAAKFHGDYAGVPPATRRKLNMIFFTPTFEIAMNKVYIESLKSLYKSTRQLMEGKSVDQATAIKARAVIISLGMLAGKHAIMTAGYGFRSDQWSRKYYKEVNTDLGSKEFVVTFANPVNLWNRYYYGFIKPQYHPDRDKWYKRLANYATGRLHPLLQLGKSLVTNVGRDFKPIANPFDSPEDQYADSVMYGIGELLAMLEPLLSLQDKDPTKARTLKALKGAVGPVSSLIFRPFTFRYLRGPSKQARYYQVRALERSFRDTLYADLKRGIKPTKQQLRTRYDRYKRKVKAVLGE